MAVGVGLAVFHDLTADHVSPFADGYHGVIAGIGALVFKHQIGQALRIERHFGDQRAVDAGQVGADQAGLAGVAAEQFDDGDALVGAGAGTQLADELDAAGDGRAEADAIVRAVNVIVHRLGDCHHRETLAVQPLAVTERVVATDGDQPVDLQVLQVFQHVGREVAGRIVGRLGLGVLWVLQEVGHGVGLHLAGIGTAGVKHRAAGAINGAYGGVVQRHDVLFDGRRVVAIDQEQTAPTAADADDFVAGVNGAVDY